MNLNELWFLLLGVLLAGYAILDGFDLGTGILHLAARKDEHRRVLMNAIGPVWDGNEVWLLTFGGALFAAFPNAYATVFSGFYTAFMLLLFALIFRAVSMEFRSKRESPAWRRLWDTGFCVSSATATLLFGVAVGNALLGLPIGPDMEYHGRLLRLLKPYALLTGLFTVALFAMHGALYLGMKTEGELQQQVRRWAWKALAAVAVLYLAVTAYSVLAVPLATRNFSRHPWLWVLVAVNVLALLNIVRTLRADCWGQAFLSSSLVILSLVGLFGAALFPELVHSSLNSAWSLDIYNAASTAKTLAIMAVIALIGMPLVLIYTCVIYRVFRGKVQVDKFGY